MSPYENKEQYELTYRYLKKCKWKEKTIVIDKGDLIKYKDYQIVCLRDYVSDIREE